MSASGTTSKKVAFDDLASAGQRALRHRCSGAWCHLGKLKDHTLQTRIFLQNGLI